MSYINPQDKIFWHLEELQQLKQGKTKAPINVEIDLSNRCSHGCSWCHFAYTHTKGPLANSSKPDGYIDTGDLFDFDLLCQVLQQLKEIGVKSVTWTGGGEPTLHPKFDEIIYKTYRIGLDQGLYTHGGHITRVKAEMIKEFCTFVYVSLDECTVDDFKKSKGVNRFDKVLEGVKNLVSAEGSCTVGLGFLLHKSNHKKTPRMIELGKVLGVDYVQFRPIINYDQNNPSQLIEFAEWIDFVEEYDDPFVILDKKRFLDYQEWSGHGYKTCHWSSLQTVITPNGKVWRCVNKRGYPEALLGDLTEQSFKEIWDSMGYSCQVNEQCRIMCRGHIANQALDKIMTMPSHENFV